MALDRAGILKNAEKLLRQGKLAQAITEYLQIVEEQPKDWNTANILGDLYVRAKQVDKAVEQFVRIADGLANEGFLPKASAVYKKILKLRPDDEHALMQAAEIAATQGLLADCRSHLKVVADKRRSKGDARGVAQITIRLASLDPEDTPARLAGARARVELKDVDGALQDFKQLATELSEKGQQAEAVKVLDEAATLKPDDPETRERLLKVYLDANDYAKAREYASTAAQFKDMAARLESAGQPDQSLEMLRDASRLDPTDIALMTRLAHAFIAKGDPTTAAQYVTIESAGNDPQLLLTLAESQIRAGHTDEGLALAKRVLESGEDRRQDVAMVGWSVAESLPVVGYQLVEMAAEAAAAQSDWPSAAASLQEFVTRVPNHVPALMRLVEICVDGSLEATMYAAQAQLTDAYITAGMAAEARFIAEDLVAREPWERANIERFRRALVLSGEPDPDAIIAERLSGESPFMSTDLTFSEELPNLTPVEEPIAAEEPAVELAADPAAHERTDAEVSLEADTPGEAEHSAPASKPKSKSRSKSKTKHSGPEEEPTTAQLSRASDEEEVDVSIDLDAESSGSSNGNGGDLNGVFARLRNGLSRRSPSEEQAEERYKEGIALHEAGQLDEAVTALESAARSPRFRFAAASLVGRIQRQRGMNQKAVEWFERAAEAPPTTADEGRLLLYDLADALEAAGEVSRALEICLELHAEAGNYRDLSSRVDRLAKVQARG